MKDKGLRISDGTHKKLYDYTSENPAFKMNKIADVAIVTWLESNNETKVVSILNYEKKKEA